MSTPTIQFTSKAKIRGEGVGFFRKSLRQLIFIILIFLSSFVEAKNLEIEARGEYEKCMRETREIRNQCSFGGCGNVAGACRDRQLNAISLATKSLKDAIAKGRCKQAEISISSEVENLNSKLKQLPTFDNTWSGYEVQVEVALLENKILNSLKKSVSRK